MAQHPYFIMYLCSSTFNHYRFVLSIEMLTWWGKPLKWCLSNIIILIFLSYDPVKGWASLVAQAVKNLSAMWETWVQSMSWKDPLEKGTATYPSILAWRILWPEEPGRLQSMGLQRVRHNWVTFTFLEEYPWSPVVHGSCCENSCLRSSCVPSAILLGALSTPSSQLRSVDSGGSGLQTS